MLYFVVNNQPTNVIVVDVFAQAPERAAMGIYPAGKQTPVTVLGDAANLILSPRAEAHPKLQMA